MPKDCAGQILKQSGPPRENPEDMKLFRNIGLILAAVLLVHLSVSCTLAEPHIAVDTESVDYGQVPFNQMVTHSFILTNDGDGPLHITGPFSRENLIRAKTLAGC